MKINILIGTPAYNGLVCIDFVNSMLDFHKNKLPFSLMMLGNESLITRGRNTIISHFYNMKEFTHLLFLDADIGIDAKSIIQLLAHDVDVIGAPVALKGFNPETREKVYNVINSMKSVEKPELYEVDKVGTAVFMMSRKAVESLISEAIDKNDTYVPNKFTRTKIKQPLMYDIFKTCVINDEYLSEDYYVCNNLKKMGYKIYVDDTVFPSHTGMFVF